MASITANDLKTKGVSLVESALKEDEEAVITVRGERKYVVLDFNTYNKLREYELDIALQEARSELASGNYKTESVLDPYHPSLRLHEGLLARLILRLHQYELPDSTGAGDSGRGNYSYQCW